MVRRYGYPRIERSGSFRFKIARSTLHTASFAMHRHAFAELAVVVDGEGVHRTDHEAYPIAAGDVFVIQGEAAHGFDDARGLCLFNLMYDPALLLRSAFDLEALPGYHALFVLEPQARERRAFRSRLRLDAAGLHRVAALLERLERTYASAEPGYQALCAARFLEVVVLLARGYDRRLAPELPMRLARVMTYLHTCYHDPIRLADLAAVANLSVNHLLRLFRATVGTTPMAYLQQIRIRAACDLMERTDRSLAFIATEVGFYDGNHFAKQFRRGMGQAPSAYRRALRGDTPTAARPGGVLAP
jgi:AraC family L-rhamnose operon transcriptional activator RhaR/AraC family L-rhamnose operon regulatory protein RhaS